jgi:hypothetical protein
MLRALPSGADMVPEAIDGRGSRGGAESDQRCDVAWLMAMVTRDAARSGVRSVAFCVDGPSRVYRAKEWNGMGYSEKR